MLRFYTPSQIFLNDFACTFKEIFRFFEIFRIPSKAATNFILRWTPSQTIYQSIFKGSKYVPTEQHYLVFRQLTPKHFLPTPYLDTIDCFCHTSRKIFSLLLRGFYLRLKQWIFFFVDMFSKLFLKSVLYKFLPCLNKHELNII